MPSILDELAPKPDTAPGHEVRHTLGLRLFGETPLGLEHVAHALLQTGALAGARVRAWAFAAALWQRLPGALDPSRLGQRADALSRDHRPSDGTVTTFDPLFPNQSFFSALPVSSERYLDVATAAGRVTRA